MFPRSSARGACPGASITTPGLARACCPDERPLLLGKGGATWLPDRRRRGRGGAPRTTGQTRRHRGRAMNEPVRVFLRSRTLSARLWWAESASRTVATRCTSCSTPSSILVARWVPSGSPPLAILASGARSLTAGPDRMAWTWTARPATSWSSTRSTRMAGARRRAKAESQRQRRARPGRGRGAARDRASPPPARARTVWPSPPFPCWPWPRREPPTSPAGGA